MNQPVKPPIGVMPYTIWRERFSDGPGVHELAERHRDVLEAIIRYCEKGLLSPPQWIAEVTAKRGKL